MESTGMSNRIHLSQDTADWLVAAGKSSWIRSREDLVDAKGKGKMQTFWLVSKDDNKISSNAPDCNGSIDSPASRQNCKVIGTGHLPDHISPISSVMACDLTFPSESHRRDSIVSFVSSTTNSSMGDSVVKLVEWNVEILHGLLKTLVARRSIGWRLKLLKGSLPEFELQDSAISRESVLEEVKKPITFPSTDEDHDIHFLEDIVEAENLEIPQAVVHQLRDYVLTISSFYHGDNHFHNFEHASHVVMTADRLLKRILDAHPDEKLSTGENRIFGDGDAVSGSSESDPASSGVGHYGGHGDDILPLLSDPLVQFAIVFSAMIHDVNHPGAAANLPNAQTKQTRSDGKFDEMIGHHSFIFAWDLLLSEKFGELRKCIMASPGDALCFRQVVLHCVVSAASTEKMIVSQRRRNWSVAFHQQKQQEIREQSSSVTNLKATCIIELLMQAADMAHAMQTWHIYQRWTEKLFLECYYREIDLAVIDLGEKSNTLAEQSPTKGHASSRDKWYAGELEFFEKHVIPVANKLKESGLLGSASDVYLNNAIENRQEWTLQGKEVIAAVTSLVQSLELPSDGPHHPLTSSVTNQTRQFL
jgi:hypothetical protein